MIALTCSRRSLHNGGISDNTQLIFYDEDDLFYRIGFELVLNRFETPYDNGGQGTINGNEEGPWFPSVATNVP